jgi:hypothetical protein
MYMCKCIVLTIIFSNAPWIPNDLESGFFIEWIRVIKWSPQLMTWWNGFSGLTLAFLFYSVSFQPFHLKKGAKHQLTETPAAQGDTMHCFTLLSRWNYCPHSCLLQVSFSLSNLPCLPAPVCRALNFYSSWQLTP